RARPGQHPAGGTIAAGADGRRDHSAHVHPRPRTAAAARGTASAHERRAAGGGGVHPILLTPRDLAVSSSLFVLDGVLSVALGLRLHRQLVIAAVRMV